MADFLKDHFNHMLLVFLAIFFTLISLYLIKSTGYGEGFKWASSIVGTAVGALLMLMRGLPPPTYSAPVQPPKVQATVDQVSQ